MSPEKQMAIMERRKKCVQKFRNRLTRRKVPASSTMVEPKEKEKVPKKRTIKNKKKGYINSKV